MQTITGYFLPRPNITNLRLNDIILELKLYYLEAFVLHSTLTHIENNQYRAFDCTVGDRKCQTRASMIVEAVQHLKNRNFEFDIDGEMQLYKGRLEDLKTLIDEIKNYSAVQCAEVVKKFKLQTVQTFIKEMDLGAEPNKDLSFLGLCLISQLKPQEIDQIIDEKLSHNKHTRLINFGAKAKLCELSIQYERQLSLDYKLKEVSAALEQVLHKGFCSMTAFYPSFIPILTNLKAKNISFVKKTSHFCNCGGLLGESTFIYQFIKNRWTVVEPSMVAADELVISIYGFQFNGSFLELKRILNIEPHEISIPLSFQVQCQCSEKTVFERGLKEPSFNVETAILSCFAVHSQFTNEDEIDFKGLNLESSQLLKEYQNYKSIEGCGAVNMKAFSINHIYASSLTEALSEPSPSVLSS
jgi:hypothetical protein